MQSEPSYIPEPGGTQVGFGGYFKYGIIFLEGEILCERLFVSFFFLSLSLSKVVFLWELDLIFII